MNFTIKTLITLQLALQLGCGPAINHTIGTCFRPRTGAPIYYKVIGHNEDGYIVSKFDENQFGACYEPENPTSIYEIKVYPGYHRTGSEVIEVIEYGNEIEHSRSGCPKECARQIKFVRLR